MDEVERLRWLWTARLVAIRDTPEWMAWQRMRVRCYNPNSRNYHRWGGRGITVCDEWRDDFWAFVRHVGRRPSADHSLHRIDNDGNYEPGNVKWATFAEQVFNRTEPDQRGELAHASVILTWDEVREIRLRYAQGGISIRALGAEYGTCYGNISHIIRNETWKEDVKLPWSPPTIRDITHTATGIAILGETANV